jgi:hypothetical protein
MITNYAAFMTGWQILAEFAGVPTNAYGVEDAIVREMNAHIKSTDADREPWVWIIEKLCLEMGRGTYNDPWDVQDVVNKEKGETKQCLVFKLKQAMDFVRNSQVMREFRQGLPVKGEQQLKSLLMEKNAIWRDSSDFHPHIRWMPQYCQPWREVVEVQEKDDNGYPITDKPDYHRPNRPKSQKFTRFTAIPIDVLLQFGIEVPLADYTGMMEGYDDEPNPDMQVF